MASSSSAVAWLSAANEQMAEHHAAQAKRKAEEAAEEEEGVEEAVAEEAVAEEEAAEGAVPAAGSGSFLDDPKPASGKPTGPGAWGQKGQSSRPAAKPKSQAASSSLMAPPPPPPLPLRVSLPDLSGGGPPSWTWVAGHVKGMDDQHEYELQMNFEPGAEQACQVDDEPFGCSCWLYITFVSCLVCDQMSC
jgi:hypothetical protein